MNKLYLVATVLLFLSISMSAQKSKNKKGDCPTYTEDVAASLPKFVMPDLKPLTKDTQKIVTNSSKPTDDSKKVDSVANILKKYYSNKTKAKGWRIQVWDGQNHIELNAAIQKYKSTYSNLGLPMHDEYDQTLFRLRIGDFTDRLEAYRYLQEIKKEFPNALLVPDQVDLSKI